MFGHIVPCGIADKAVTSLRAEGRRRLDARRRRRGRAAAPSSAGAHGDVGAGRTSRGASVPRTCPPSARDGGQPAPDAPVALPAQPGPASRPGGRDRGAVDLRAQARVGEGPRAHQRRLPRGSRRRCATSSLVTVCEEAGCPNISECWADGTATFMINGERCTRACGFCLVDTRHPLAGRSATSPSGSPTRSSRWVCTYAVVTAVARDDLADGGAAGFAATIEAIRRRTPDSAGRGADPRLQGRPRRARRRSSTPAPTCSTTTSRPCPGCSGRCARRPCYARSLVRAGPGQGGGADHQVGPHRRPRRDDDEVDAVLADLRGVGVDIVTVGQYLRPTDAPPARGPLVDARASSPA